MTLSPEQKAERAERILESDVFQEAVERAKAKKKQEWTTATTPNQREALWHEFQALEAVVVALRAVHTDGRMERHNRERQEKHRG